MYTTFMGTRFSQDWQDLFIWENFFEKYPMKSFIELGTGSGGMSIFFALQCFSRGIQFHTFDHQRWLETDGGLPALLKMGDNYHIVDLFSDVGTKRVAQLIADLYKPMAIFFDNGNKPKEWQTFAPLLSPGDFCIVHDWGTEFLEEDMGDVKVERIMTDLSDLRGIGWKSMWFVRK